MLEDLPYAYVWEDLSISQLFRISWKITKLKFRIEDSQLTITFTLLIVKFCSFTWMSWASSYSWFAWTRHIHRKLVKQDFKMMITPRDYFPSCHSCELKLIWLDLALALFSNNWNKFCRIEGVYKGYKGERNHMLQRQWTDFKLDSMLSVPC